MNVLMQFASDFICLDSCSARRTPVPTRENVSTTALTGNKLTLPESTFELRLRRGRKRERQRERESSLQGMTKILLVALQRVMNLSMAKKNDVCRVDGNRRLSYSIYAFQGNGLAAGN